MPGYWEQPSTQPQVLIGVPIASSQVPMEWALSFRMMDLPNYGVQFSGGLPIDLARNNLVNVFLQSPAEWLFFLDSDVAAPRDTFQRLAGHNLPIVSGLYYRRKGPPFNPCMWREAPGRPDYAPIEQFPIGLVEADVIGMGCCLIHRSVFSKVPRPWFRWTHDPDPAAPKGLSEDFYFCTAARKVGYKIFVDTGVRCLHYGQGVNEGGGFRPSLI